MAIPPVNQPQVNEVAPAVFLWDLQPAINTLKDTKDIAVQATAVATLPAVQQLAAIVAPSIPAPARDVVVAAGCARVTEAVQDSLDGAIDRSYAHQDSLFSRITRWFLN